MLIVNNLELIMSKIREPKMSYLPSFSPKYLLIIAIFLGSYLPMAAQSDEFKQKIEAFKTEHSEQYELKFLNIPDRDLGMIDDTYPAWKDKFLFKGIEKVENNLGSKSYPKFFFNLYTYETLQDRQYALKDWMEKFLEGESIRPGREVRTYDYATPTLILINDTEIIILNYKCSDYTDDNFEYWEDELIKYFGADNTMLIEVLCGGPLKWTKNAPDPRETRGLF